MTPWIYERNGRYARHAGCPVLWSMELWWIRAGKGIVDAILLPTPHVVSSGRRYEEGAAL
jgi:hypothetical protein